MGAETESSESESEPELCVSALKRRVADGRVTVGAVELVRALTGGTESAARKHLQRLMEQLIELAGQVLLVGVLLAAQGGEEISHR